MVERLARKPAIVTCRQCTGQVGACDAGGMRVRVLEQTGGVWQRAEWPSGLNAEMSDNAGPSDEAPAVWLDAVHRYGGVRPHGR